MDLKYNFLERNVMAEKDIVVLGGGPAGYVAAIKAAQLGGKVTLVEKGELGGTCLNVGCIPTKALLRGVEVLDLIESGKDFGIQSSDIRIDFAKLSSRKERAVKTLVSGVGGLMRANGIEVIKGNARLTSPRSIQVENGGQASTLEARKVIIATGSSSSTVPIPGAQLPGVIDSTGALQLNRVPESMVIIGGGPIGLEFG
ncbi:MAG TPA: FAD-dependent oxidoreductase, partial [Thermodesulfobacteriota bacterium]|nr:FAD-dependent oxidoreductase [Thermodesulfobacteriota bacterium]